MSDLTLYKQALKDLSEGDVLVSFNKTHKVSAIIASTTDSSWSHVSMYIGQGMILESSTHGVVISPLKNYFQGKHNIMGLTHVKATLEKKIDIKDKALSFVGKRYGYLQMLWYAFVRLVGKSEDPTWQLDLQPRAMVCSEAIAKAYKLNGYDIKPGFKSYGVEPVDFVQSKSFKRVF